MKDTNQYIIIDTFGDPIVCTNEEGKTLYFETKEKANKYGFGNL